MQPTSPNCGKRERRESISPPNIPCETGWEAESKEDSEREEDLQPICLVPSPENLKEDSTKELFTVLNKAIGNQETKKHKKETFEEFIARVTREIDSQRNNELREKKVQ